MINGIKFFEKIILVTVLIATVVAIGNEFMFMYSSQEVTLADLLLLFIYIEVVQMVENIGHLIELESVFHYLSQLLR